MGRAGYWGSDLPANRRKEHAGRCASSKFADAKMIPNYPAALDAAPLFCFHVGCRWRGASEQGVKLRNFRFMNPTATTYRPSPRRVSVVGFVLCAVLAILFWDAGAPRWNTWITRSISVVCGLVALMLVFYKEVSIDPNGGVV